MALSRPTTPITPLPRAPTTPIRNRALSPPSKSPIATPPPPSPIPHLPWRDQITWDHLNPHSAPIVDNFDDEWDIKTLVPQTPPQKILLSKDRLAILRQRLQAGHGTHRVHYIVYDDYVRANDIPDSHMILVTGDPRRNGGILSLDGVDVEEGMVVEKRDGFWGVYEAEDYWDNDEEEEEGEVPAEQQIYQVFLEGADGDHEEAWNIYERFRAHQERQARKERVYQVMLQELEGNEALAREVHALFWREQEEQQQQQMEHFEDEGEEETRDDEDDEEQDVFARATMWAKGFRKGYEVRDASLLQKSPTKSVSSDVHDDMGQSSESKQEEPDVHDCLGEWAVLLNGERPRETTTSNICEGTNSLIDTSVEQDPNVYDCLDEWARSLEHGTKHASLFNEASRFAENKDSGKLIEMATTTPDVYECLGLWAQQFEDI